MFSASPTGSFEPLHVDCLVLNVSKFIDQDLSSIQKIITESLKDNRSLEVKAVNEMMKIQLESLLESIRKTKQSTYNGTNEPVGEAENISS
jgi:hypothetical protein